MTQQFIDAILDLVQVGIAMNTKDREELIRLLKPETLDTLGLTLDGLFDTPPKWFVDNRLGEIK